MSYIGCSETTGDKTEEDVGIQEQFKCVENKLFFQDELKDLEIGDDVILVFGGMGGPEIEAAHEDSKRGSRGKI